MASMLAHKKCVAPTRSGRLVTRPSRQIRVQAASMAEASSYVAQAFMRIFSPPSTTVSDWNNTSSSWVGKISRARRPFKDGFSSQVDWSSGFQGATAGMTPVDQPVVTMGVDSKMEGQGYVAGAVSRVINHNFKGDVTEPDWSDVSVAGFKGDIHGKRRNHRDGFHARKL